jgi:hypothetical protein
MYSRSTTGVQYLKFAQNHIPIFSCEGNGDGLLRAERCSSILKTKNFFHIKSSFVGLCVLIVQKLFNKIFLVTSRQVQTRINSRSLLLAELL